MNRNAYSEKPKWQQESLVLYDSSMNFCQFLQCCGLDDLKSFDSAN